MGYRHGRVAVVALFSAVYLFAQSAADASDAQVEQRDFAILMDGKEVGQSRITITAVADGTTIVSANAQLKVNQLLFKYSFSVDSTETWKDGKLNALKAASNENGKRIAVEGSSIGSDFRLVVNGRERLVSSDTWPSSFWKLADARFHNKSISILEADSGKDYTGQLQYVGTEQLTLQNQPQSCYHFQILGGAYPVDVWFDRFHRLVRQEFTDSGHRTIVQLVSKR